MKVCLHKRKCGWRHLRQNVNRRQGCWIRHQRQLKNILDRAAPQFYPDPIIFMSHILVCRVWRPMDIQTPEIVERDSNGAAGMSQSQVQNYVSEDTDAA